jgi:hypothetical protein
MIQKFLSKTNKILNIFPKKSIIINTKYINLYKSQAFNFSKKEKTENQKLKKTQKNKEKETEKENESESESDIDKEKLTQNQNQNQNEKLNIDQNADQEKYLDSKYKDEFKDIDDNNAPISSEDDRKIIITKHLTIKKEKKQIPNEILKDIKEEDKFFVKTLLEALEESDEEVISYKITEAFGDKAHRAMGLIVPERREKDFKNLEVIHSYEKDEEGDIAIKNKIKISKEEKEYLENITKNFLKDFNVDSKEAQMIKERRRDIMSYSMFEHFRDLKTTSDLKYYESFTDYKNFEFVLKRFDRLAQFVREEEDLKNPAFIAARSQNKLLKDSEKKFNKNRDIDVRQNFNSPDYLKIQPRLKIDYNYNTEQHKEFNNYFQRIFDEDQKKLIEKMKLVKYVKTNWENYDVKSRWIGKHFPVTADKLPDYDVDISDYKPNPTKKSRRKYEHDNYINNFSAWRCFDRDCTLFFEDGIHVNVELKPINLIKV